MYFLPLSVPSATITIHGVALVLATLVSLCVYVLQNLLQLVWLVCALQSWPPQHIFTALHTSYKVPFKVSLSSSQGIQALHSLAFLPLLIPSWTPEPWIHCGLSRLQCYFSPLGLYRYFYSRTLTISSVPWNNIFVSKAFWTGVEGPFCLNWIRSPICVPVILNVSLLLNLAVNYIICVYVVLICPSQTMS